jgi:hypothetical protein
MLVEIPSRARKLWTFKEVESSSGRPIISEWYSLRPPAVRAVFDDRISFLGIHERKDWQLPEFRMLRGREGKEGISEVRWKEEGLQWRVLGFFGTGKMEYTMLIGCVEKYPNYDPPDALETAVKRKKSVERGERKTRRYEYD